MYKIYFFIGILLLVCSCSSNPSYLSRQYQLDPNIIEENYFKEAKNAYEDNEYFRAQKYLDASFAYLDEKDETPEMYWLKLDLTHYFESRKFEGYWGQLERKLDESIDYHDDILKKDTDRDRKVALYRERIKLINLGRDKTRNAIKNNGNIRKDELIFSKKENEITGRILLLLGKHKYALGDANFAISFGETIDKEFYEDSNVDFSSLILKLDILIDMQSYSQALAFAQQCEKLYANLLEKKENRTELDKYIKKITSKIRS